MLLRRNTWFWVSLQSKHTVKVFIFVVETFRPVSRSQPSVLVATNVEKYILFRRSHVLRIATALGDVTPGHAQGCGTSASTRPGCLSCKQRFPLVKPRRPLPGELIALDM